MLQKWCFQVKDTGLKQQISYCGYYVFRFVVVLVCHRQKFGEQGSCIPTCHLFHFAEKAPKEQKFVDVRDKVTRGLFHQGTIVCRIKAEAGHKKEWSQLISLLSGQFEDVGFETKLFQPDHLFLPHLVNNFQMLR